MNDVLNERFLHDIEFTLIREWLSKNSRCRSNKKTFLQLSPDLSRSSIRDSFKSTHEILDAHTRKDTLPIQEISFETDEAISFLKAEGRRMEASHFFEIYSLIIYGIEIKKSLKKDQFKIWAKNFSLLSGFGAIQKKTLSTFNESFIIRDDASKDLKNLNQDLKELETKQISLIDSLIKKYLTNDWLESDKQRIYSGRTVLSVKNKFKNKVRGIIQGYSRTNQTTFIEPFEVIEINNEIQSTKQKINKEHIKILTDLTVFYRSFLKEINFLVETLKSYDWFFTLASMAHQINCIEPSFSSTIELKKFRNPIMELNGLQSVALDLKIERKKKMVMISGPNAGGKTVTLKSIGLASAMAQSGIMVPSSIAKLKFFECYYSDIGDNQSIENNLSTFSAHISSVSKILKSVKSKSCLVLIDEIGSSTDPNMGSALSQAICESLIKKNCLSVITTHLTQLKLWAHNKEEILSAGMEFHPIDLVPTYRLVHGEPSSSHTLELGERFGISKAIIKRATELINSNELDLNKKLLEMNNKLLMMNNEIKELKKREAYLNEMQADIENKNRHISKIFKSAKNDAFDEAKQFILSKRKEIEKIVKSIRENQADKESIRRAKAKIESMLQNIKDDKKQEPPGDQVGMANLKPGQRVFIPSMSRHGTVESIKKTKVRLNVDSIKITMESSELTKPEVEKKIDKTKHNSSVTTVLNPSDSQVVVDVRGLRSDEALEKVKKHLDSGLLNNLDFVKILHGKGTGALKNSIHSHLESEKYVKKIEFESPDAGGEGITIVHIK